MMEIQKIKNGVAAVFVGASELITRGITGGVNSETTHLLAKEAFDVLGERDFGEISIDAYINGCGLLLFAEMYKPKKSAVLFSCLENLLSHVATLDIDMPSRLVLYDGKYCLIGTGTIAAEEDAQICTPEMESSQVLIESNAVERLRTCFRV